MVELVLDDLLVCEDVLGHPVREDQPHELKTLPHSGQQSHLEYCHMQSQDEEGGEDGHHQIRPRKSLHGLVSHRMDSFYVQVTRLGSCGFGIGKVRRIIARSRRMMECVLSVSGIRSKAVKW